MDKKVLVYFVLVFLSVVNSAPKDSLKYMGDFVQIRYDNQGNNTNVTVSNKEKSDFNISQHHLELLSDKKFNLQNVLSDFTNALSNVLKNHVHINIEKQYNASHDINNKTQIFVNAFELHNVTKNLNNSNQSATNENAKDIVTNIDVNITPKNSSKVAFSEDPIQLAGDDKIPYTLFSKMTFNDILTGSISSPVTKENVEDYEMSTPYIEATTMNIINDKHIMKINPHLIRRNSDESEENIIITKNLNDRDNILNLPMDKTTNNFTESQYHFTKIEDLPLDYILNRDSKESLIDTQLINNDSTTINTKDTRNFLKTRIMKPTVTPNILETILKKYASAPKRKLKQSPENTMMEENLSDMLDENNFNVSNSKIKTAESSTLTISAPKSLKSQNTTATILEPISSIKQALAEILNNVSIVHKIVTSNQTKLDSMELLCCKNKTVPIINDMKWINVDKLVILMPMLARIDSNNTTKENATEERPKINTASKTKNLGNHPMNGLNKDKFMPIKFDPKEILKRDKENELYDDVIDLDDILNDDNGTDYLGIDYVDFYKDVVVGDVETATESNYTDVELIENEVEHNLLEYALQTNDGANIQFARSVMECHGNATTMPDAVFPWIVTIFKKNDDNDQFEYYCDGALLNNKAVLTTARCVYSSTSDQLIVIMGKTNLKTMRENEVVIRVSQINVHPGFTQSLITVPDDDLAVMIMDSVIPINSNIRPACIDSDDLGEVEMAGTTGWALTGELTPIFFKKDGNYMSDKKAAKFFATYGSSVSVCPSHGGVYLVQREGAWYLGGVSASDPSDRSLCIIRTIQYTALRTYRKWISDVIGKD